MKTKLLSASLYIFLSVGYAYAQEEVTTTDEELTANTSAAPGEEQSGLDRYDFKDRGISMVAPAGWSVSPVVDSKPIEIVAPKTKDATYLGNIKVMRFNKHISLGDSSKEEISELIKKKHSYLSYIEGYDVQKGNDSELNDGTPTVLYYSDFSINGLNMKQAHLVVPANEHHFIVTYTDLADNFEGDNSIVFLESVWPALASIKVADPALYTSKFEHYFPMAAGLGFLLLASILVFRSLRRRSEEQALMENMESDKKVSMTSSQEELDAILDKKIQNYDSNQEQEIDDNEGTDLDDEDGEGFEDFEDDEQIAV